MIHLTTFRQRVIVHNSAFTIFLNRFFPYQQPFLVFATSTCSFTSFSRSLDRTVFRWKCSTTNLVHSVSLIAIQTFGYMTRLSKCHAINSRFYLSGRFRPLPQLRCYDGKDEGWRNVKRGSMECHVWSKETCSFYFLFQFQEPVFLNLMEYLDFVFGTDDWHRK